MTAGSESWTDKIGDNDLRQFVASDRPDKISVLVEVDAPEPLVEFAPPALTRDPTARPIAVKYSRELEEAEKAAIEQTRTLLDSLGLTKRFLPSARVFVIDATPHQLRCIVEASSVRAIIPNRSKKQ